LAARSEANVLLTGETGTGKEGFARTIHRLSRRCGNPLVAVNVMEIPATLLEGELFGYQRGAFTGAERDHLGRFEEVHGGTLLLDEIGHAPAELQVKLLRVIEQREFRRLGASRPVRFEGRLISATSVNLEEAANEGRFRRDLLGRVNQFHIKLPPLRERRDDIPLLLGHFLRKHSRGTTAELGPSARKLLERFDYPGNVRQLENAVIEAVARCAAGETILPRHLPEEFTATSRAGLAELTIRLPEKLGYREAREEAQCAVDRLYLLALDSKHSGNQTRAAKEAGIDPDTFAARLAKARERIEEVADD
ncbi:MAG: sigma 54-interacting transcriptional regulator, partial [Acidobacteriota bacterium]